MDIITLICGAIIAWCGYQWYNYKEDLNSEKKDEQALQKRRERIIKEDTNSTVNNLNNRLS